MKKKTAAPAAPKLPDYPIGTELPTAPFSEIRGMCTPIRALEIALAGYHSIVFVGAAHSGKSTLIAAALELSTHLQTPPPVTGALLTCYCGAGYLKRCICPPRALERHYRRMAKCEEAFDICAECVPPGHHEFMGKPMKEIEYTLQRIAAARKALESTPHKLDLDDPARRTLEMAVRRLEMSPDRLKRVLSVSRTIAALRDAAPRVLAARDIAEAVQYREVLPLR